MDTIQKTRNELATVHRLNTGGFYKLQRFQREYSYWKGSGTWLRGREDLCETPEKLEGLFQSQGNINAKSKQELKKKPADGEEGETAEPVAPEANPFARPDLPLLFPVHLPPLRPALRALLAGSRDAASPLSILGARPLRLVVEALKACWLAEDAAMFLPHLRAAPPPPRIPPEYFAPELYAAIVATVAFPEPQGINVNMMPVSSYDPKLFCLTCHLLRTHNLEVYSASCAPSRHALYPSTRFRHYQLICAHAPSPR